MVKTIFAVLLAATPACAADFNLERAGLDAINKEMAVPAVAAPEFAGSRLQVSEINNRWIAAVYVAGQRLARLAGNANGIAPSAAPAGLAIELGTQARRTLEGAEKMHYAAMDGRWHVVKFEAEKLDRVVDNVMDWAAACQAHHNAAALKAGELAAAGRDLATALQWLRADSSGLRNKEILPAVMPLFKFGLSCASPDKAVTLEGMITRKGGDIRVTSADLYKQHGGEGENLRFFPEAVYVPGRAGFLSSDSAFFNYTLEMPSAVLAEPGEFEAELLVSFGDETSRRIPLDCSTSIIR